MKKRIKRKFQIATLCVLVFMFVLALPISALLSNRTTATQWNFITNGFIFDTNAVQLFNEPPPISPLFGHNPNVPVTGHIYTDDGQRLGFIAETGMVVTEHGNPVTIKDTSRGVYGSLITIYDEERESFIDSANRTLGIYLDSRLNRRYLRSGGNMLREINLDQEVWLVNFRRSTGESVPIYVTHRRVNRGWWAGLVGPRHRYFFYDMNGRQIEDNRNIEGFRAPTFWQRFLQINVSIVTFGQVNLFSFRGILERTTLRELMDLISNATEHPWVQLRTIGTNEVVRTMDGHPVVINPHNGQLANWAGFSIWDSRTGYPIVFYDNEIWRVSRHEKRLQEVNGSQLQYSMTMTNLLISGQDFFMGSITTNALPSIAIRTFDIPLLRNDVGDWFTLDGSSADGRTDTPLYSRDFDPVPWSPFRWFSGLFDFGGLNWALVIFRIILIAVILLVLSIPFFLVYRLAKKAKGA